MKSVANSMPSSLDAVKATEAMNTLYRLALRKQQRYRTEQVVHIHRTLCRSVWPRGFGELNPSPHSWIFTSVSPQIAQRLSVLAPIYLLPLWSKYRSPVQNLSEMWRSTFVIGAAQLRSVTEFAPKSPFLRVNRSPIWYNFRTGAKGIRYSVNMA